MPPHAESHLPLFEPIHPRNGGSKPYGGKLKNGRAKLRRDREEAEPFEFWNASDVRAECLGAANKHIKFIRKIPLTRGLSEEAHALQHEDMPLKVVLQRMALAHFASKVPYGQVDRLLRLEERHALTRNALAISEGENAHEAERELKRIAAKRKSLLTDVFRKHSGQRDLARAQVNQYERLRREAHEYLRGYLKLYFKYPGHHA